MREKKEQERKRETVFKSTLFSLRWHLWCSLCRVLAQFFSLCL